MTEKVRIGTRGSPLALAQTRLVTALLRKSFPKTSFEVKTIKTHGDILPPASRGGIEGKAAFTTKIEDSLLKGEIDVAVHSLKDLPNEASKNLVLAATPRREDPRDVLIARGGLLLKELPRGGRIGTSSLRRRAQILALRRDLHVEELHGNIGTRLEKLLKFSLDGIVLAAAGLIRLGETRRITEFLSLDTMLPAPGQGALAVQIRSGDSYISEIVRTIDDSDTHQAVVAERAFSLRLGGDCHLPLAAYATVDNGNLSLDGLIGDPNGDRIARGRKSGRAEYAQKIGEQLAEKLLDNGAYEILSKAVAR